MKICRAGSIPDAEGESLAVFFGESTPDGEKEFLSLIRNAPHFILVDEGAVFLPVPFVRYAACPSPEAVAAAAGAEHVRVITLPGRGTRSRKLVRFILPLKYSLASFLSFLVDYAVFLLLGLFGAPTALCVYGARVVSASFNYLLNRKYVFYGFTVLGLLRHFLVVAVSVTLNYLLLSLVTEKWGLPCELMKPAVDLVLFFFGYACEHLFVFRKKELQDEIR